MVGRLFGCKPKQISLWILLGFMLFSMGVASAQKTTYNLPNYDRKIGHFGFLIGINRFDFTVKHDHNLPQYDSIMTVQSKPQMGFNLGIISNLRLGKYWDLRFIPTLAFGERMLSYTITKNNKTTTTDKYIESTYIDFPLLIKLKSSRMGNTRVYVVAGGQFSYDLVSQSKKRNRDKDEMYVKLDPYDGSLLAGIGMDFYLQLFKLGIELKGSWGFNDLCRKEENNLFSNSLKSLNSQMMQFSILFE